MKATARCRHLITQFEGLRYQPYICPAGKWTIGIGHRLYPYDQVLGITYDVKTNTWKGAISPLMCDMLLTQDIEKAARAIDANVTAKLTQGQFDALVSFILNVGGQAFRGSTMLHLINQKQYLVASRQFARWVHDDHGKEIAGLVTRREAEKNLFLTKD